jgi:hypothetical protein
VLPDLAYGDLKKAEELRSLRLKMDQFIWDERMRNARDLFR